MAQRDQIPANLPKRRTNLPIISIGPGVQSAVSAASASPIDNGASAFTKSGRFVVPAPPKKHKTIRNIGTDLDAVKSVPKSALGVMAASSNATARHIIKAPQDPFTDRDCGVPKITNNQVFEQGYVETYVDEVVDNFETPGVIKQQKLARFASTFSNTSGNCGLASASNVGECIDDMFSPVRIMARGNVPLQVPQLSLQVPQVPQGTDPNWQGFSKLSSDEAERIAVAMFGAPSPAAHKSGIPTSWPSTPAQLQSSTNCTPSAASDVMIGIGSQVAPAAAIKSGNTGIVPPVVPAKKTIGVSQGASKMSAPKSASLDKSNTSKTINSARSSADGRPSKSDMCSAPQDLTVGKIQEMGENPGCSHVKTGRCLHRENVSQRMALGANIIELYGKFNCDDKDFHKGQALMDFMWDHEVASHSKKRKVEFKILGSSEPICGSCWRLCAGFAQPCGRPTSLYAKTLTAFNDGAHNAKADRVAGKSHKLDGGLKNELRVAVTAFLATWLPLNSDKIPEDVAFNHFGPPRAHVDVARKTDIWHACCLYLEMHYPRLCKFNTEPEFADELLNSKPKDSISKDYFMKILNDTVHVVIHKHKRFSQCVTCFLFKQLIAKCANPQDMLEIRAHRKHHFDTVFAERVVYHQGRNWAKENPELGLSMILDAQTKWRTQGPTLPREVGSGFPPDFEAFGQQLYGCLVHALDGDSEHLGGFFGYMVDDSVRGGGNVTCEIIYKTLVKLQGLRKVWPALFDLRLDNTTKDNKNKCVFGFLGWLVLTDVFQKVRVRYLSVGHTHEDIDALFGVLMQQLYRGQCYATIEVLMDAIYNSFFSAGIQHSKGSKPSAKLEHLRATHDWTSWLTTACKERDDTRPAVNKLEHFARRVPDSHRPHEFVFSKMMIDGVICVVLNYKHWSKDEDFWNKKPIVVFDHVPNIEHLQPSPLNPAVIVPLSKCVAAPDFIDHNNLCSSSAGEVNAEGSKALSKLKSCPRCKVQVGLRQGSTMYKSGAMFTEADQDAWGQRFAQMNQVSAIESLQKVHELRSYSYQEPKLPFVMPACMAGPTDAYLSVEPVTYEGYSEAIYQRQLKEAGLRLAKNSDVVSQKSESTFCGVTDVVGARRITRGHIEVAVVWDDPSTIDGGTWIPLENLNTLFEPEDDSDDNAATNAEEMHSRQQDDLEKSTQMHNWNLYFGRDMAEDTDVVVGFKQGRNTTVYAGVVITGEFDDSNGCQRVLFPVMAADPLFGTAAQAVPSDYISLRLDSMECTADDGTRDSVVCFWLKKKYVALPFITKAMPILKLATAIPDIQKVVARRSRKSRNARISSSDEEQTLEPKVSKKTKGSAPVCANVTAPTKGISVKPKRVPKAQEPGYQELLQKMRGDFP